MKLRDHPRKVQNPVVDYQRVTSPTHRTAISTKLHRYKREVVTMKNNLNIYSAYAPVYMHISVTLDSSLFAH